MKRLIATAGRRKTLSAAMLLAVPLGGHACADGTSLRLPPVTKTLSADDTRESVITQSTEYSRKVDRLLESFKKKRQATESAERQKKNVLPQTQNRRWLRSSTSAASFEAARRMIQQASQEYSVGAWASAENSAWEAVRLAAEGVEFESRETANVASDSVRVVNSLRIARTAIRESRDFSGRYGRLDNEAIARMAQSHETQVLKTNGVSSISSLDAIDRYLNEARIRLSGIAAASVEAAQAMDLLAAIHLGRADAKTLPSSTALCLRRAAMQGQPNNASLALRLGMHLLDLGLDKEARWALEHSLRIEPSTEANNALAKLLRRNGQPDLAMKVTAEANGKSLLADGQAKRIPEIEVLSPTQFAAASKSVVQQVSSQTPVARPASTPTAPVIAPSTPVETVETKQPSKIRRFFGSLLKPW